MEHDRFGEQARARENLATSQFRAGQQSPLAAAAHRSFPRSFPEQAALAALNRSTPQEPRHYCGQMGVSSNGLALSGSWQRFAGRGSSSVLGRRRLNDLSTWSAERSIFALASA